jgi:hypothetical protein
MLASIKNLCISEAFIVAVGVLDSIRVEETTTTTMWKWASAPQGK